MVDRVYDVEIDAVHPISVIPFFFWLTWSVVSKVGFRVDFIMDFVVVTSPVANLHLVVGVISPRIEYVHITSLIRCSCISFPEVAVD